MGQALAGGSGRVEKILSSEIHIQKDKVLTRLSLTDQCLMAPLDDKWKTTLCTTSTEVPIDEGNSSGPVSLSDSVWPENDNVNYLPCGVPLYVSMQPTAAA